jgi:hypothetical protein
MVDEEVALKDRKNYYHKYHYVEVNFNEDSEDEEE